MSEPGVVESSLGRWARNAVLLWGVIACQKLAAFAFQIGLGRRGGFAALGVVATIGTASTFTASFSSLGLADRAMYRAADARSTDRAPDDTVGTGHGLYLGLAALGFALLAASVPWVVTDAALRPLAWSLVLGAFASHVGAYSIAALRGFGEPRRETLATLVTSAVLALAAATHVGVRALGLTSAATGLLTLAIVGSAMRTRTWLRPAGGAVREILRDAQRAVPYLAVGTGCVLLGGADILLARLAGGATDTGVLQCATAVVRAGLYGPWMFGALLVHRVRRHVRERGKVPRVPLVAFGVALGLIASVGAWVTMPWVLRAYGVPVARVLPSETVSLLTAPTGYVALLLLPVATGLAPLRAAVSMCIALIAAFTAGSVLAPRLGVPGAIIACAMGYLTLTVALLTVVMGGSVREDAEAG
ncbi:MAG: hypothetical protein WCJ30_21235 [Deltaproteobacteria bacterium]